DYYCHLWDSSNDLALF
nr:immunoglobulin light chain junction region [Macaca mulatta]